MTLSDALSLYRSISDATHKLWGYFQAVAVGTAAFAWSQKGPPDGRLFVFLAIAFTIFAGLNLRLVVSSQSDAVTAARSIREYALNSSVALPPELKPMIQRVNPDPVASVGLWHVALSLATLGAVWWRYITLPQ